MDDDDAYLYGGSIEPNAKPKTPAPVPQPVSFDKTNGGSNGVVAHLEAEAMKESINANGDEDQEEEEEDAVDLEGEDSEDDVEIIMEPHSRSLDFRQTTTGRPPANRPGSSTTTPLKAPQPSLTTEYTPIQRGGLTARPSAATPQSTPSTQPLVQSSQPQQTQTLAPNGTAIEEGPDPSALPPAMAPPSHPTINPEIPGSLDGRSILEMDLSAMAEKPWRRPGSDLSDWFNYGFDEISWEAYCYRRRDLGELGNVLKQNVLNFAGMPEDQLSALPPEVRQMVMTGATALMSSGGPNAAAMMGAGVGMNPMMDMSGMMAAAMGMGMNGDIGMQLQPSGQMGMMGVQEGGVQGPTGAPVPGTVEQAAGGVGVGMPGQMIGEGYPAGGPGQGMMGMGMGGEFAMQEQNQISQQMYSNMEPQSNVPPGPPVQSNRGGTPISYRGRGMPPMRRGFQGRGRGRGMYGGEGPPPPVRPASPLPPGVPTGPRNQNKYKDRDGNAPAVDGLDYGGAAKEGGYRTPSGEPEDRSSSRKRRNSPGLDDGRGPKRR